MNGARDQLFAGAAFAADEDGRVSFGDLLNESAQAAHGFALANDGVGWVEHLA